MTTTPQQIALEALRLGLRRVFPDPRAPTPSLELAMAVARALPEEVQESLFGEVLGLATGLEYPDVEPEYILGYYAGSATHERHGVHRFTEVLPMVRVLVPETRQDITTEIGIVFAGDHPRYTRSLVETGYQNACAALAVKARARPGQDELGLAYERCAELPITRVERYTPARYLGARFAAVAVDALYTRDHVGGDRLTAYRFTGGLATGEPLVDYTSPTLDEIVRQGGYAPTPMSDAANLYTGNVEFDNQNTLTGFSIAVAHGRTAAPHVQIRVRVAPAEPATVHPALLTARAAARVAAICAWLNTPFTGAETIAPVLAAYGRTLPWEVKPQ